MAKANEKKTRGKRSDTGAAKRGSKAGRAGRQATSGAKRGEKDRIVKAPPARSRRGAGFSEQKRKSMDSHRREITRETGEIRVSRA